MPYSKAIETRYEQVKQTIDQEILAVISFVRYDVGNNKKYKENK